MNKVSIKKGDDMSNQKHLADLLKVCSILPALAIMPAMASGYTVVPEDEISEVKTISGNFSGLDASTTSGNQSVWFVKGADVTIASGATFDNNKADSGIFSTSSKAPSSLTLNSGVVFENNTVRFDGGAVANYNTLNANGVTFRKNTAQTDFENDTTPMGGGALALGSESKTMIQNSIFSQNESKYHGGAIAMRGPDDGDNSAADLDIIDSEFRGNIAAKNGGAIYSTFYDSENVKDSVYIEDSEFVENKAVDGGAIYNEGLADRSDNVAAMKVVDSEFVGNIVTNYGGAVYNGSKLVLEDSEFSENNAYVGGAMFLASGSDTIISNSVFDNNTADYGGAVYTSTGIKNVNVSDSKFTNNSAKGTGAFGLFNKGTLTNVLFENNKSTDATSSAGALFLGALAQAQLDSVQFVKNTSASVGGAIAMRGVDEGNNKDAKLDIIGGSFIGNTAAAEGGAIFSTFYDSENVKDSVYIKGTEFTKNSAERGGAIYTEGKADLGGGLASMKIEGAKFTENMAAEEGGAIQNRSSMNITDSVFKDNVANGYYGGALYNAKSGNIETLDADFSGNKIVNEGFAAGGAIANIGKIGELTGMFDKNVAQATGSSAKGGAIHTYAGSYVDSVVADFTGNSAVSSDNEAIGGAIVNDGNIGTLHQAGSGFVNNSVSAKTNGWAGALYNSQGAVINELVANFTGNSVQGTDWAIGGALVNMGTIESMSGVFENNSVVATSEEGYALGGAIYNGVDATINFDGDVLFSNNTAVEGADIYNDGIVNIVSGTTTIDTAVAGEGTLNVASDAILNIGTATVQQTQINIDGIVQASVLSDRSYGRLLGLIEAKDSAELKLNVGSVGSYKIFDSQADITVTAGATYDVSQEEDGTVVIATKAVEDIATGAGISTQAAGAVAGLANADSGKAHQVSLALQKALNSGDAAFVEAETKKLNPTDKPVAQAAATSIQNQVLALASGRMAGGISVGRAGGDEMTQENGFWMQGLFNKSKFADAFHGYTRGIALGADTLIDKTWTIGGGLAFNNSDVHADGAHTDIDSKTLFLYGQYKPNKWYVNGTLTYNMSEYTENKTIGGVSVEHEYDVDAYGAQVMTGYDFATGITTEAGLRYLYIDQDSYVDGLDRQIMATDTDFLSGVAGVKYAFAIENDWAIQLRPELRAAMTYDFISDDTATTVVMPGAEAYAVKGERLSRMGGEFGIGLTALYKGMELSVMYDLDLHKDYTSQTGMIKFRTEF